MWIEVRKNSNTSIKFSIRMDNDALQKIQRYNYESWSPFIIIRHKIDLILQEANLKPGPVRSLKNFQMDQVNPTVLFHVNSEIFLNRFWIELKEQIDFFLRDFSFSYPLDNSNLTLPKSLSYMTKWHDSIDAFFQKVTNFIYKVESLCSHDTEWKTNTIITFLHVRLNKNIDYIPTLKKYYGGGKLGLIDLY